jgi:hypothetical protein
MTNREVEAISGLLAALRELRLPADLCPTDRAQAQDPGRRGPLRAIRMPACCRPWGEVESACPPGPGRPLTGAQLEQALLRAVPIGPPPAPDAPLPDDLDEYLRRTGLAP